MLNRVKNILIRPIRPLASTMAKGNVDPNILTVSGLVAAILTPLAAYIQGIFGALLAIAISSLLDALDGEVARSLGRVSRVGAFIDSLCDRVSDLAYIGSLMILGVSPVLVYIAAGSSVLISYIRARAESLGIYISGIGLMERGERILGLLIVLIIGIFSREAMELAMIVFTILTLYTAAERTFYSFKLLSRESPR
ncbi:MAG: CDP-alcohol phosphatidyltransferase family protein [Desulfurococcales archaeon]|jgi:archaetidylinositol phosphate synthase|nr:CDP-alcohol phosphatidyltransferase family protein [Desulfurococcales archaeon]